MAAVSTEVASRSLVRRFIDGCARTESWRRMLAIALGAAALAHAWYHVTYTLDDAYISFRYARNLVRGVGLVYNPGSYVKGYSNTLLTLFAVIPELFGCDPKWMVKLTSLAAYVVLLVTGYRLYDERDRPEIRDRACWFVALCAASTPLALHFVNGLETGLYTTLLFVAVTARAREQDRGTLPYSALWFTLAVLSRPEGIAVFGAVAAYDFSWRAWQRRFSRRDLAFFLLPSAAYATELVASQLYYGRPLPQTYYAKAEVVDSYAQALDVMTRSALEHFGPHGYLRHGLDRAGFGIAGLIAVLFAMRSREHRRRNGAYAIALFAQLVFIVRARGDWAPAFRFGAPLLPFLFALAVEAVGEFAALARKLSRPVGWCLAIALLLITAPRQLRESRDIQARRYVNAESKLLEGALFAHWARPGMTLSSADIGGHGYAAGGFDVLDTGGLTVPEADCRHHHCMRYAELVLPELIRVHSNRKRDAFVTKPARKHRDYLELDGGKYLLLRSLAFPTTLPDGLTPLAGSETVVAHDAPEAVGTEQTMQLTLYWAAGKADPDRRLEWLGPGHFNAEASPSLLLHMAETSRRPAEVFADLTTLRAPSRAGRYELHLIASGARTVLGAIDVLDEPQRGPRAQLMAAKAQALLTHGHEDAALRVFGAAAELSRVARRSLSRAVCERARALRARADSLEANDPLAAFRVAMVAREMLERAYWQGGGAGRALRAEIDANGKVRQRIIDRVMSER